ncbi:MAG: hypothetical protein QM669_16045 [Siphonobacter sp.]
MDFKNTAFGYKWILPVGLGAYILFFYIYVILTVQNIPTWDDLFMLEWLVRFQQELSFINKVKLLFEQHADHILLVGRFLTIIFTDISSSSNIYFFTLFHSLFLLIIPYVFYLYCIRENVKLYHLSVPILLLFSIHYYHGLIVMGCFNHTLLYGFSFAVIYLLSYKKNTWDIYLSILLSVLVQFSNTAGTFLLITGAIILLLQADWKSLIRWSLFSGLILGSFFSIYQKPAWSPDFKISHLPDQWFLYLKGFFGEIGGVFSFLKDYHARYFTGIESFGFYFQYSYLAFGAGIVIFLIILIPLIKYLLDYIRSGKLTNGTIFLVGTTVFLFGLVFSAAILRLSNEDSLLSLFVSRYKLLSICLLISGYFLVISLFSKQNVRKGIWAIASLGSLLLGLFGYFEYFVPSQNYYKTHFACLLDWEYRNKNTLYYPSKEVNETAFNYWKMIIEKGLYEQPALVRQVKQRFSEGINSVKEKSSDWRVTRDIPEHVILSKEEIDFNPYWGLDGNYLVLWNKQQTTWQWLVASKERQTIPNVVKGKGLLKNQVKIRLYESQYKEMDLAKCYLLQVHQNQIQLKRVSFSQFL